MFKKLFIFVCVAILVENLIRKGIDPTARQPVAQPLYQPCNCIIAVARVGANTSFLRFGVGASANMGANGGVVALVPVEVQGSMPGSEPTPAQEHKDKAVESEL
ncbi:hypothetical protein SFRURICE_018626 [Spodoptera frugiperda]|nr:hypothetical protein SFRURICE_018626 [Spodoptera frugiperda]